MFHKRTAEVEFYDGFFKLNSWSVPPSRELINLAFDEACATGMSGMDALHIAAAVFGGAKELITSERVTKPMHRTKRVRVVSIYGSEEGP